ncbi:hypothetical protein H9P43_003147 [Blastocladiella emersonii ATCC 22665]|nr:hypothetical protein H9P43_003147 [Blastocladiella emersonii ATCC 22665]
MEAITDQILAGFFALEKQIAPITAPYEQLAYEFAAQQFPEATRTVTSFLGEIRSPYADQLPFMNPAHMLVLVAAYLAMVVGGKAVMSRSQTKFTLKTYALVHNIILTSLSAFMCVEVLRQAYLGSYSLFGNSLKTPEQGGTAMAKIVCVFYLSKILEFNDTLIMLGKRNLHQVSFLHVYHHSTIFAIWWLVTLWAPTGESYFSAMLNSFIHVVMYGYYGATALGFKQVSLLKKYITSMQMTQFMCMMVQATYNIAQGYLFPAKVTADVKPYPLALSVLLWGYMVTMLALFGNFYRQDRKRDAARRAELAKAKATKAQ